MNYNICEDCNQKYCGWAESTECQECGGKLKRITREEFYSEEKDMKDIKVKEESK